MNSYVMGIAIRIVGNFGGGHPPIGIAIGIAMGMAIGIAKGISGNFGGGHSQWE